MLVLVRGDIVGWFFRSPVGSARGGYLGGSIQSVVPAQIVTVYPPVKIAPLPTILP